MSSVTLVAPDVNNFLYGAHVTKTERDGEIAGIQRVISNNERLLRVIKRGHFPCSVVEDAAYGVEYLKASNRAGAQRITQLKGMAVTEDAQPQVNDDAEKAA